MGWFDKIPHEMNIENLNTLKFLNENTPEHTSFDFDNPFVTSHDVRFKFNVFKFNGWQNST